jgi:hypothetical protein
MVGHSVSEYRELDAEIEQMRREAYRKCSRS